MAKLETMRKYVSNMYPGMGWKNKVAVMPYSQVAAIYLKSINGKKPDICPKEEYHQYTLFEFGLESR